MTAEHREPWHLDKRVPVVIVGAILAQTFGFGWWASQSMSVFGTPWSAHHQGLSSTPECQVAE